ncbi:hypothetical protein [Nocardia gipuzkoensis]
MIFAAVRAAQPATASSDGAIRWTRSPIPGQFADLDGQPSASLDQNHCEAGDEPVEPGQVGRDAVIGTTAFQRSWRLARIGLVQVPAQPCDHRVRSATRSSR